MPKTTEDSESGGLPGRGWQENYDGGSPEAEQEIFQRLIADMLAVQESNRQKMGAAHALRTLHAKAVIGIANARFDLAADLPERFAQGHFQPGRSLQALVRLSNASGIPQADAAPDMRGAAVRLLPSDEPFHDLLMTSYPVSHARNAQQFVAFAVLAATDRANLPTRLRERFGEDEASRMMGNVQKAARPSASLATERYWSRGAILWGEAGPVRYQLRPLAAAPPVAGEMQADGLRAELTERLRHGDVRFRFCLQAFVDERRTPIEDGAVEWAEAESPLIEIATLVLPRQDLAPGGDGVEDMAFNPWNAPPAFRPLGNLNRARKGVYTASAAVWRR